MSSDAPPHDRTPADFQRRSAISARRAAFFATIGALTGALLLWLGAILGPGGFALLEIALLASFAIPAFWLSFLVVNALIAVALIWRDARPVVSPYATEVPGGPLERVAILVTIRNEDTERVYRRLAAMRADLDATGEGSAFDVFVLSDTDQPKIAAHEERLFDAQRATLAGAGAAEYRRRDTNDGFKAGNLRDWVERRGDGYELMLCLDADSVMSGATIVEHARIMAGAPKLALLQSLIYPAAGDSAFTRALRFGAQCHVRTHYLGHAWWQADAGPFGGHNAFVRVAPFRKHCVLPEIDRAPPLGGAILGHDHVEAAQLQSAGYEVRLLPEPAGSWEDHPVDAVEFSRRDRRWGLCNMQYAFLLRLPGLNTMGRFHLAHLVSLFLVPPAAMASILFAAALLGEAGGVDTYGARVFVLTILGLALAPKLVGYLDAAWNTGVASFGGPGAFAGSAVLDLLFTLLLAPAVLLRTGLAVVALWLPFGVPRGPVWGSQSRDASGLSWRTAAAEFWPATAFGLGLTLWIAAVAPGALIWASPALIGLLGAIPFAVWSASPETGGALRRAGLLLIPAETDPHPVLRDIEEAPRAVSHPSTPSDG